MIPLRLQLQNFMSYGEGVPPLDFTGIRVACLSGDNGNGKTALLDAMTWALYGETRATTEDDVVRLGATDCQVIFDFQVGGSEYRIHKARGRRGGTAWELQVRQEDGSTRSLSGTSARETKARIEQLLRMDYRTFLSSGYLAQGRADEFARASVNDRKKVLADILDLSRYERLEAMAKERRKDAEDRETDAERDIRSIDTELEREDGYHLSLENAQARLKDATGRMETDRAKHDALVAEVQRLEEREARARDLEARIPEFVEENAGNARQLAEVERRIAGAEAIVARRDTIEAAYARFVDAGKRIAPLEAQYDSVLQLQREQTQLEKQIRVEHDALDRERYRLECEVQQLVEEEREIDRYQADVERLQSEIAGFGDMDARSAAIEERRLKAEEVFGDLKTELGEVKAHAVAVEKRLLALRSSDASLCEYCGQPLPPDRRHDAIAEAEATRADLVRRNDDVTRRGRDARKAVDQVKEDAERVQRDLRQLADMQARLAQATQERLRVVARTQTLPDVRRRFDIHAARIAQRDYARPEQERLIAVSAELERLERVGEELAVVRAELTRLTGAERDRLQLQNAEQVMATDPARAVELRAVITRRETQIANARKQIDDFRRATATLPEQRRTLDAAAAALRRAEEEARASEREIGQYTSLLEHCARQRRERDRRTEERLIAAREKELYRELIAAFGRKGVQALIIENALPEIETQANELLGRMTDGALQLRLVTQRDAKSKSATASSIETLDIILADEMGTRPYEMYSGGEAFRINFALRVALSRLLAQRAGAPLQTLILDEGFGTQDPRGREAIVDAILNISDSFALILVITHIDELKEAFPTRIEVTKGPSGSSFSIS
jgi:exonuclease SbcC